MSLAASLLLALAGSASAAETITPVETILKNRDAANGRHFCVVGKPVITENKVGRVTGKHLFRGKIDDGTGTLELFAFGRFPAVATGELIEVCGKFHKYYLHRHGVGYHDEIVAEAILKGKGIGAGLVEITPKGIVAGNKKAGAPAP